MYVRFRLHWSCARAPCAVRPGGSFPLKTSPRVRPVQRRQPPAARSTDRDPCLESTGKNEKSGVLVIDQSFLHVFKFFPKREPNPLIYQSN
jgi:hypothetical protein